MTVAIITKFVGPTNTRGSRIIASCPQGRATVPYPYELSGEAVHRVALEALLAKLPDFPRTGWHAGSISLGYAWVQS